MPWRSCGTGCRVPRPTIIAALADRHPKDEVKLTIARLAVTERLVETGGKHTLPASETDRG